MTGMAASHAADKGALAHRSSLRARPGPIIVVGLAAALLVAVAFASLMYGAVKLAPGEVWSGLSSHSDVFARTVVWQIRYPRVLDAMLVGAALAVSGSLLQGVTRNPLADPTLFGISAAAALASTTALVIDRNTAPWLVALCSVGGGLVGAGLLFVIAWRGAISPVRLALAGVALSAFFGALIVGMLASSNTFLQTSLSFLAGGLYAADWNDFHSALPYVAPGLVVALLLSGRLNVLALGDDVAGGLGVLTDRTRFFALAVAGVLAAAAVSVAGLVSFVGLVCPHLARHTVGSDHRYLIPVAALYGALLVAAADLAARMVIAPSEIPMGIITAAVGAPFLLYLVKFRG
jgi:iron complex transport system permease protein